MSGKNSQCESFIQMLDAFVDNELDGSEREHVAQHLSTCEDCNRQVREIEALKASLSSLPRRQMKFDLADNFDAVLSKQSPAVSEKPNNVVLLSRKRKWLVASASAAAVVLIAMAGSIISKGDQQQTAQSNLPEQAKTIAVQSPGADGRRDAKNAALDATQVGSHNEDFPPSQQEQIATSPVGSHENKGDLRKTAGAHLNEETQRLAHGEDMEPVSQNNSKNSVVAKGENNQTIVPASQSMQGDQAGSGELLALYEDDDSSSDIGVSTDEDGLYAIKL